MRALGSWSGISWILCAVTVAFCGCNSGTAPPATPAAGTTAATTLEPVGPPVPGSYRIVLITNGSSPFWDAADRGMKEAGQKLGVKVEMLRNDNTEGGQIRKLQQLATQSDVKAVGISVVEAQAVGVAEQMIALRKKGVHVLTIDSDGQKDARTAFVGTDNVEGGRELGKAAAQLLPAGGKAVCFVGIIDAQNARERIQGFEEGAAPGIKRIETKEDKGDENKARNDVTSAIQNHPDLKVLAGIWSYNAPAIADVVKAANRRKDFTIVTFDAEPNAIVAMQEGMIDAMVVQNPYEMGYQGVVLMDLLVQGKQQEFLELLKGKDYYDTGLKVIVPDENSPVKSKYRMLLKDFKAWLTEKNLEGS